MALVLMASCFTQSESDDDIFSCNCPEIFEVADIVCGENEIQYLSACEAECFGIKFTAGPCPIERDAVILNLGDPALDACGWVARFTNGNRNTDYTLDGIPPDFLIDQLEVTVKYRFGDSSLACGLTRVLKEIEVIEIQKR